MAAAGDVYERELKHLLSGEPDAIARMTKTCTDAQREAYQSLAEHPFMVVRAAGSLGADLVALRGEISFLAEVKSSDSGTLYLSKSERLREQAKRELEECGRSRVLLLYAYRLKGVHGDPWRVFVLPSGHRADGRMQSLKESIPGAEVSRSGNYILHWKDGMEMSELVRRLGE